MARRRRLSLRQGADRSHRLTPSQKETDRKALIRASYRAAEIVPMGTMGGAIPLRTPTAATRVADAVKQIGTPRSPYPIMRRPRADREEKRETHGRDDSRRTEKGSENRLKKARSSLTQPTPIREALRAQPETS